MPIDGYKVIDGDAHVMEPPDLWTSRMDERRSANAVEAYGLPVLATR